ncbi:MAG: alpha/beta hydrolase [Lachnospiraceae bacterium]|nr:alpha/beta hydrolase [Lachnospiraceae bacterium]
MKKEFAVKKKDNKNISGIIYRPEGDGVFPAVIFSHGFGATYRDIEHYGDDFIQAGIVCVFFDFCGGSPDSKSDGTMLEMTLDTEVDDLRCVMDAVKDLPYVDNGSLYLMGESMGGTVSAIAGCRFYDEVKGLILWYPAFNIPDDAERRMKKGIRDIMGMRISGDFDSSAAGLDVVSIQEGFDKPVLIIHGDADDIVPIEYSKQAVDAYEYALMHDIPGAGHGFKGDERIIAKTASISFVKIFEEMKR